MPFVTLTALQENLALTTGVVFHVLATISHPDLTQTIRIVNNRSTSLVSNGNTFLPVAFDVVFGSARPEEAPSASASIDDVTGTLLGQLLALDPSPTIDLEAVLADDPDNVHQAVYGLVMEQVVKEGVAALTFQLSTELLDQVPFPGVPMTRDRLPALYTDL